MVPEIRCYGRFPKAGSQDRKLPVHSHPVVFETQEKTPLLVFAQLQVLLHFGSRELPLDIQRENPVREW